MIKVYDAFTDDFSGQGLGYIFPIKAEINEEPGGMYEIELEIPIDESRDDWIIDHRRIIAAKSPTRTSPEINFGLDGTIERQIFKTTAAAQMYNLSNRNKKLSKYKKGTEFVRLESDGEWYKVAAVKGGATGWIKANILEYVRAAEDEANADAASKVIETVLAREQLFRIHYIKRNTKEMIATVQAEHITYDLLGVICESTYAPENIPADEAVAQLIAKADQQDLPFKIYCQCTNPITADYTGRNLIDCLLNSDDGIAAQCNARVIRDNFNIYLLNDEDRFTGAIIRYGDNLIKAIMETESGDAISRIRPVGKNKKGERLYITENNGYVDAPNAAEFPFPKTKEIEYSEAQTGKNGLANDTQTRTKLKELALQEFEDGAAAIATKLDAEFVRKELMREYIDSANEIALHMYDTARIRAGRAGINADVRMMAYKFDALPGRERYIDAKISDIQKNEAIVYGGDIGGKSIHGSKIINNTIDGTTKLKNLSVGIAKIDVAAIEQLNANSITAIIARLNEIVAGNITTDELYAAIAEITALKVESLTAADIETDRLAAALAAFTVITAGSAEFDRATAEHLVANLFNLTGSGVMEEVFIHNLKVAYAEMVGATIGNLVLKSKDGNYYEIDVNQNGMVTASPVAVTEGEISTGQTEGGKVIVETSMTVNDMNAATIKATHALINKITAASIDTDELFANKAFINQLITSQIYNDTSLRMVIGEYDNIVKWFTFDAEKGLIIRKPEVVDEEGNVTQKKSIWSTVTDEKGYHVRSDEMVEPAGSFEGEGLTTPSVKIGEIRCKRTSSGGWVWADA